jgi:multidrug resistance efflux pump
VKEGDLLFEIDARPFEAALDEAGVTLLSGAESSFPSTR